VRSLATPPPLSSITLSDPQTKRFHNHLSFDRRWLDDRERKTVTGELWGLGIGWGRFPFRSSR